MACGSPKDSLVAESKSDEEEGEDEEDIQYALNKLYEANIELGKTIKSLKNENKTLTQENENLKESEGKTYSLELNLSKCLDEKDELLKINSNLSNENKKLKEEIKELELR